MCWLTRIVLNVATRFRIVDGIDSCKTCEPQLAIWDVRILIWIAIIFCIAVTAVAILQRVYVALFESRTRWQLAQPPAEKYNPKTALILCLRGADPSLHECLRSIEGQDFEDLQLHVVVDDMSDPALAVVNEFQENSELSISIHLIENRLETCSLKCSAIITAIKAMDGDREVIALIDADAIVTSDWLSTLVQPLSNSEVGVSTGNRWFRIPKNHRLGAAVRGVWNAAAVVQMYLYEIPWGGSLAFRREVIDKANLLEHWSRGFCEDTMLTRILHREGYQIARPAELVVVNDESTTVGGAFRWIQRQLLTVRLHHPRWALVWLHGLATGLPLLGIGLIVLFFVLGASYSATMTIIALVLYQVAGMFTLKAIIDAHQPLLERSQQFKPDGNEAFFYLLAMPLTQFVHFFAVIFVTVACRVHWRKIEYSIGHRRVKLLRYLPFDQEKLDEQDSIE